MSDSIRAAGRFCLVAACCLLSVSFFFRYQILNGFTVLFADRFDGMIVMAILEHWYNVFRGLSHWSQPLFLYPFPHTLAYQDGYFVNGVFYSGFRALGADPFLASEIANIILRAIGFLGAYLACRRVFRLGLPWALLASVLFTLSNSSFIHTGHIQLLTISFAPLMAVLLHGTFTALLDGRRSALLAWGLATILLYAAWLMSGYYMAWYFLYFSASTLLILLALSSREQRRTLLAASRREALPLIALAAVMILVNLPFLNLYLPAASQSGQESYQLALSMTPSPLDIPNVGEGNLLYGRLITSVHDTLTPALPPFSERTTGMPLILLFLFGCAIVCLWQGRKQAGTTPLAMAMSAAVLLTWATVIHVGHYSLWYFVYHLVPGAKSMRATGRYQIFLAAPVIVLAVQYLGLNSCRIVAPVLFLVCALLLVEEVDAGSPLHLDRQHEVARLHSVPRPPSACRVFFASAARPETVGNAIEDNVYSANVDAMLIAEYLDLPTINGLGAVLPPGWSLVVNPSNPAYMPAVSAFASRHHITGLCGLDLRTMRWNTAPGISSHA